MLAALTGLYDQFAAGEVSGEKYRAVERVWDCFFSRASHIIARVRSQQALFSNLFDLSQGLS
jgi:hypothetical protein